MPRRAGIRGADDSPTLSGFLEHARGLHARELSPGQEDRRITVSTIHRAKGTEARLVVLAGCEERLLPSWRTLEAPEQLQEERRLFYVACTRAKDQAVHDPRGHARRPADRWPIAVPERGRAAMSTPHPGATTPLAAALVARDARMAAQTRPLRRALRQTERYTDLRGQSYPLASMSGAEALLVLALLERHAETLHRGELAEHLLHGVANEAAERQAAIEAHHRVASTSAAHWRGQTPLHRALGSAPASEKPRSEGEPPDDRTDHERPGSEAVLEGGVLERGAELSAQMTRPQPAAEPPRSAPPASCARGWS